jgi:hypothetical protein
VPDLKSDQLTEVPEEATVTRRASDEVATGRLSDRLEANALSIAVVCVVAILCLAGASAHVAQDAYLALVDGRVVALTGIPQHSHLTVMAHGVRWIDQQWLAQLAFYGLQRAGGYALLVIVDVALVSLALGLAIFAARDLGANERQVVRVLPFGAIFYIIFAVTIRSQVFAYPLFAVTLWLLASAARGRAGRRVFLVFPILLLWANLHGSATMGAGLVMLYGLTRLIEQVGDRGRGGLLDVAGWAFIVLAPLCLLANPYGFSIIHYYDHTLLNSQFGKLVTEWKSVFSQPILALPYLLYVAVVGRLVVLTGRRTPLFDWLVLLVLAVGGVLAVRNIIWFALATIVLLPPVLAARGKYSGETPRRRRLDLTIAYGMLGIALIVLATTATHPASWFQRGYDGRAVTKINSILAGSPHTKIFTDVRFGDWLLWQDPRLVGHVAYDISFEQFPTRDLEAFTAFYYGRTHRYSSTLNPYTVLVLDPTNKKETRALLSLPNTHVVLRTKKIIVATKPANVT